MRAACCSNACSRHPLCIDAGSREMQCLEQGQLLGCASDIRSVLYTPHAFPAAHIKQSQTLAHEDDPAWVAAKREFQRLVADKQVCLAPLACRAAGSSICTGQGSCMHAIRDGCTRSALKGLLAAPAAQTGTGNGHQQPRHEPHGPCAPTHFFATPSATAHPLSPATILFSLPRGHCRP